MVLWKAREDREVEREARGQRMAKVVDEILESFYAKLSESDTVSEAAVRELRRLFASQRKPKANDFVAILEKAALEDSRDSD